MSLSLSGARVVLSDDLLEGVKAAADFTGLPERTILHLIKKGEIPSMLKGRRRYFRKSEIVASFSSESAAA